MGRIVIILLALFAAPTIAWFTWRWFKRDRKLPDPSPFDRWQEAPWMWLILGGLAIAVAAVLAFGILEPRDCKPVPAQWTDGKFVPAHCE